MSLHFINMSIPKLREQTFQTAIMERYRRRESSIEEALVEMYLAGVSTRRVADITEALWDTRVSSAAVSKLNQSVYEHRIRTHREVAKNSEHYRLVFGVQSPYIVTYYNMCKEVGW